MEAVTNTVRHARAQCCRVTMTYRDDALAITVTDDGIGLRATGSHGHGLAIMRERAEELGGAVTVANGSPGVTVQARLPTVTSRFPSADSCASKPSVGRYAVSAFLVRS